MSEHDGAAWSPTEKVFKGQFGDQFAVISIIYTVSDEYLPPVAEMWHMNALTRNLYYGFLNSI